MHSFELVLRQLLVSALGCCVASAGLAAEPQPLSLEQAVRFAVEHNAESRLSMLAASSAAAARLTASAAPNPTLTLQTFNINPRAGIGAGSLRGKTVDSTVRLDQLIERGGKRGFRTQAAQELELAAHSDVADTRRQLLLMVSQAYYALMAARDKVSIARRSAELSDATIRAAKVRQRAGDLSPAEAARAEVDALRAHNDVAAAESELFDARQALGLLIGTPDEGAAIEPSDRWPDASSLAPAGLGSGAARADLRAAQHRLEAALATRKLALASRSADVTVGIQAEHYPASLANAQGSGNSYGIAVQIPLMLRHAYEGEIRAAEVAVDSARENLDKLRRAARNDILVSSNRLRATCERLRRDDEQLLPAAKRSADAAEFAFVHGALGIMDLLDVRRTFHSAQLEALAARTDCALSFAAVRAAVSESEE